MKYIFSFFFTLSILFLLSGCNSQALDAYSKYDNNTQELKELIKTCAKSNDVLSPSCVSVQNYHTTKIMGCKPHKKDGLYVL